jgi:hypothetical protein
MAKKIDHEDSIFAALQSKGWSGTRETLRSLAAKGDALQRRYGNECSYQWADTPSYHARTEQAEGAIVAEAEAAGLQIYLQTDPRGATIYVDVQPIPDNNYNRAHCLIFA